MPDVLIKTVSDLTFKREGEVYASPIDWRDAFIYFLLVDRFDNNKDLQPFDELNPVTGRDLTQGRQFQGGNLRGIIRRLDYIKNLGANTLWLSPIFKNRIEKNDTYHGYGIQDFLDVDPRFGNKEDLKELVRQAHRRGMHVILDIILNHTGDNWAYANDFPFYYWDNAPKPFDFGYWREADIQPGFQADDAVWPEEFQNISYYKRRGQIRDWTSPEQALNGDFLTLKELDLNNALDPLIKAYKYWIATADIDGFRLDTVKHMETGATAIFCNAVREYAKSIGKHNFFLFGEIVADDYTLQKYIGRNSRIEGTSERFPSLDAALDFPLYFVLEEVIKGFANPSLLRERYERFKTMYADHGEAGQYFVTFVDNHDQMSRPYKRFMHGNKIWQQAILAIGYLLTSQGVPCIYYGTEQGFDGGGDNDCFVRECMFGGNWGPFDTTGNHFFNQNNHIYKAISTIAKTRLNEPALRYGRQYFREISGNGNDFGYPIDGHCTLAYSRILDDTEILVALNLSGNARQDFVTLDYNLNQKNMRLVNLLNPVRKVNIEYRGNRRAAKITLEPYEIGVYKAQK